MNKKYLWLYIITIAIGIPLFAGFLTAAECKPSRVEQNELRVISHNIAGGPIHQGKATALTEVNRHINEYKPHVVVLQEVCASQVAKFAAQHPAWNITVSQTRFSQPDCKGPDHEGDPVDPGAPNGDEQYDVVASPRPMRNDVHINLQEESHSRVQWLTCAEILVSGEWITACTTHIKVQWAEEQAVELGGMEPGQQARQIKRVAWWVDQFNDNGPVVVGGDFNSRYEHPNYQPMRKFQEEYRAIDHVVYARLGISNAVNTSWHDAVSDHPLLRSRALFR